MFSLAFSSPSGVEPRKKIRPWKLLRLLLEPMQLQNQAKLTRIAQALRAWVVEAEQLRPPELPAHPVLSNLAIQN